MAKDPAFLFYSKDWLQGTSSMMPEEKGVYIDLLSHQHQDGDLPADTKRLARMVGLSEEDFIPIWAVLQLKFKPNGNRTVNRLVNRKLTNIMTERLTKGLTNKITGTFASIIRTGNFSDEIKSELKKSFKIDDFLTKSDRSVKERLTDWIEERLGVRLKSIANANGNTIEDDIGGVGGKEGWVGMPGKESFGLEIPDIKKGAAKELFYFSNGKVSLTDSQLNGLWDIFKKQNFTGSKFYATPDDAYSHFINWVKTQKINGTDQSRVGKNSKSNGLDQVIGLLKQDIESGT